MKAPGRYHRKLVAWYGEDIPAEHPRFKDPSWTFDFFAGHRFYLLHNDLNALLSSVMNNGNFYQEKRQREVEKARKKRDKAAKREQRREQGPARVEIVSAEDVVGRLPTSTEAMLAIAERAKAPRTAAGVPCRLFVGGLSWDTTVDELREVFSKYGKVIDAVILSDHNTGRSRGFGFVTFENRKDGAQAVENLNGYELDGRNIVVNVATGR